MNIIITIIAIIGIGFLMVSLGIWLEKRDFNNGICPHCGNKLYFFDMDSQGGRGYKCEKCYYHTWVSYKTVDKDYWEK